MDVIFQIDSKQNYSIAQFDIHSSYETAWKDIIKIFSHPNSPDTVHYFKSTPSDDGPFITIRLFSTYELCLQLLRQFQDWIGYLGVRNPIWSLDELPKKTCYWEECGYDSEEEFKTDEALAELFNSDEEMPGITTVSYDTLGYEGYGYNEDYNDALVDYGYSDDMRNPFEVY